MKFNTEGVAALHFGTVAQLVERRPEEAGVVGSSPTGTTKTRHMKEAFYVKSCQYNNGKVTTYFRGNDVHPTWSADINEAKDFGSYPLAQAAVAEIIQPGDRLQIEKYFVV